MLLVTMAGTEQGPNRHGGTGKHRNYTKEAENLFKSARKWFGCVAWDNDMLKATPEYQEHRDIMDLPSFGWLFKPLIIRAMLKQMVDDDILFWMDSCHILYRDPQPMIEVAAVKGVYAHIHHRQLDVPMHRWTKRDTFVYCGCDKPEYWKAPQLEVNVLGFSNTPKVRTMVEEWYYHCSDYKTMIDDGMHYTGLPDIEKWDHRHEQSILTLMLMKHGFVAQEFPVGMWTEETVME